MMQNWMKTGNGMNSLSVTSFVIQITVHTTLGVSPAGHLVHHGRDMILPIQYKVDGALITQKK